MKKGGLGKGLEALFADNAATHLSDATYLKITEIEPNSSQPRQNFDQEALEELAQSIREHGVLQPLVVRPLAMGGYQIVAGERRWRASRLAGLTEVPVVIKELSDSEVMELALVENLQREDLNPIEEALGYQTLLQTYHLTQEQVAQKVGKSRPVVANAVRMLSLPQEVIDMVREGKLTAGHARALSSLEDEETILSLAYAIENGQLNVREAEKLVKKAQKGDVGQQTRLKMPQNSFYAEAQLALGQELSRKVKIKEKDDKGYLEIEFFSQDDLKELMDKLCEE